MTGYEWLDLSNSFGATAATNFGFIVTLASAYLIAAYAVGVKLTRSQLVVINVLFVTTMIVMSNFQVTYIILSQEAYVEGVKLVSALPASNIRGVELYLFVFILDLGILFACLKFMHDVRRNA